MKKTKNVKVDKKQIEEEIIKEVNSDFKNLPLSEKLDMIIGHMENYENNKNKKKSNKFKLPRKVRRSMKNFHKKNKIMIFLLTYNWSIKIDVSTIVKGMVKVQDNWHSVPADSVWLYEGKIPAIILPEWDINPIGLTTIKTSELYNDANEQKRKIEAQTTIIRAIKNNAILEKARSIGGKVLLWIIIGGIIVVYLMFGK